MNFNPAPGLYAFAQPPSLDPRPGKNVLAEVPEQPSKAGTPRLVASVIMAGHRECLLP